MDEEDATKVECRVVECRVLSLELEIGVEWKNGGRMEMDGSMGLKFPARMPQMPLIRMHDV